MTERKSKIRFISKEHEKFYNEMLGKSGVNDCYHRSFFYCTGISEITRANINKLYDFKRGCAEPGGLHGAWQTGSTIRLTRLALNLWNGYTEQGGEQLSAPYELFSCEYAPYFYEAIKLRFPEYCRELPVNKTDVVRIRQER